MEQPNQPGKPQDPHDDRKESLNAFAMISMIGADMAGCTIGGTLLGRWLDKWLGTSPWLLLLGILVGLAAGIYGIIKLVDAFGPNRGSKK